MACLCITYKCFKMTCKGIFKLHWIQFEEKFKNQSMLSFKKEFKLTIRDWKCWFKNENLLKRLKILLTIWISNIDFISNTMYCLTVGSRNGSSSQTLFQNPQVKILKVIKEKWQIQSSFVAGSISSHESNLLSVLQWVY